MPETLPPSHVHAAIAKIIEDIKKENNQRSETIQTLAQNGQFVEMIRLQEIKTQTTKIMWELEKILNTPSP